MGAMSWSHMTLRARFFWGLSRMSFHVYIDLVNGTFNVVLLGASTNPTGLQTQLQVHNTFTWENKFRAFCARDFVPSVVVSHSATTQARIAALFLQDAHLK